MLSNLIMLFNPPDKRPGACISETASCRGKLEGPHVHAIPDVVCIVTGAGIIWILATYHLNRATFIGRGHWAQPAIFTETCIRVACGEGLRAASEVDCLPSILED